MLRGSAALPPRRLDHRPAATAVVVVGRCLGCIIKGNYDFAPEINDFDVLDAALQQSILYYSVQRDYRKCAAPLCGGFWLKALATTKTTCSDGSVEDQCYVASLNLSGLGLTPEEEQVFWIK
jgi:hypothetical protein